MTAQEIVATVEARLAKAKERGQVVRAELGQHHEQLDEIDLHV